MLAHHFPVRRRRFMRLAATVGVLAVIGKNADPVRAATPTDVATDGTSPLIYAPRTGHHLSGAFLSWWLQHGRERVLGWPISESFDAAGRRFQFFERGLLEHSAEVADPSRVWPLSVGRTWLAVQREAGIGSERVDGSSAFWFDQTGFGVHSEFWPMFRDGGGAFAFGYPISAGLVVDGQLTQLFDRARLVLTDEGPLADNLGAWEAPRWLVSTEPVEPVTEAKSYRSEEFAPAYGPVETRWADVNLTTQTATFYDGDEPVYRALISSGRGANFTPPGAWEIWHRTESENMTGGQPGTTDYYSLQNVYFTQYFTPRYVGFHYAYWHDEFGTAQSHGCVNMRLDDARWTWHFLGQGALVHVSP